MVKLSTLLLGCVLFITGACDVSDRHHDVYAKLQHSSVDSTSYNSYNLLQHDRLVSVEEEGYSDFFVHERKGSISNYKCSGCHEVELAELKTKGNDLTHADIRLFHSSLDVLSCFTCHNPDNLDELRSTSGKSIDFDQSYKLCSQCHSSQFSDWRGGSHGKRIGGWVAPRVSKTCVECHNPHSPGFESRMPTYPAHIQKKRS
ncbi:Cytochrome c7 [Saccharicrinis carchari]|uniref:Cytochrome c7 n=1 Tax=Saccharicrinis carchari TaxID=1168039 RepID=A0A521D0C0_SACCC|nr:cytochrome C [Saccharicrinis carchari]SMO64451.1 Cytochrome c7 [Saccharicrinis carchari]